MSRASHNVLQKDDNGYPVMGGISTLDPTLVVNAEIDPITGRLLVDSSGGVGQVITPTGTVDGSNTTFTVPAGTIITSVVVDGLERYSGFGYTYNAGTGTITVDPLAPPVKYIRVNTATVSSAGQVQSVVAGTNITVNSSDPANPIISASTVGSGFQIPTGAVDGLNTVFIFTTTPNAIVVDGAVLQKTEQGSLATVNWTGTTTVTLSIAPVQSIFSIE